MDSGLFDFGFRLCLDSKNWGGKLDSEKVKNLPLLCLDSKNWGGKLHPVWSWRAQASAKKSWKGFLMLPKPFNGSKP
jgi:hypothetical protein